VLFECPNHAELLEKAGVRTVIEGIIDELMAIAAAQGCSFPGSFHEQIMRAMVQPSENQSLMYQDFIARRPLEIETFLGSPIRLAKEVAISVPRIETLYALLHNLNIANQKRPLPQQSQPSPNPAGPPTRLPSTAGPHPGMNGSMANGHPPNGPMMNGPMMNGPMMNGPMPGQIPRQGMRPGSRAPSMSGGALPPMRRGPSQNGYPPRMMNGHGPVPPRGPSLQRRPSAEGNDLEEFSHLMLYDNMADGQAPEHGAWGDGTPTPPSAGNYNLRERELMLRQREIALREQELNMRRGPPPQRRMPPSHAAGYDEDDDDDGDYFDPMQATNVPHIDPDNFDMMSVTSRRTRKAPSAQQLRANPEMGGPPPGDQRRSRNPFARPKAQSRASTRMMADVPGLHDSIMSNGLLGLSSDRYGNVDRHTMGMESRSNSLTAERLQEFQHGGMPMGGPGAPPQFPPSRRASQSPGNPLSPRPPQRRSPPIGYDGQMPMRNGRPSPPGMRAPVPRYPPGHGNAVAPHQVEQQVGVSNLYPPNKGRPQERSLTGSASASAGSGESAHSARLDSDPSAHSSSSSLGPRPPIGVR